MSNACRVNLDNCKKGDLCICRDGRVALLQHGKISTPIATFCLFRLYDSTSEFSVNAETGRFDPTYDTDRDIVYVCPMLEGIDFSRVPRGTRWLRRYGKISKFETFVPANPERWRESRALFDDGYEVNGLTGKASAGAGNSWNIVALYPDALFTSSPPTVAQHSEETTIPVTLPEPSVLPDVYAEDKTVEGLRKQLHDSLNLSRALLDQLSKHMDYDQIKLLQFEAIQILSEEIPLEN